MAVPAYPSLPGLMFPVIRIPEWDSDVQVSISGKRTSFSRRAFPRYRYQLTYSFFRTASPQLEFQTLLAFYNMVNGRANVFTYVDSDDTSVTTQLFGTGDASTVNFQLVRSMTGTGSYVFVEPVFYIITAAISKAGVLQTLGVDYTISSTGLVTFTVAPALGASLTWTGTYGWYCRFDEDTEQLEKFAYNLYELKTVKFSTELF